MGIDKQSDAFQLRRIQFVPARRPDVTPVPTGVDIIVLNGVLPDAQDDMKPRPSGAPVNTKELFREQDVSLRWKTVQKTGAGLQNLGNTCFMNSVLQCLTHTPPLAEALLASKQLGSNKNFDPLRLTQQQVINSLQNKHKNQSVAPTAHAKSLRQISKSFRLGRQEDAHEYLVALLDAMHESYISMCRPKPSPELSQTSMIYRIFAGKIRSQVKCTECGHESNTHDVFLDLSLEINKASSVVKALQRFTSSEYLDGANKYICPKQKQKVRAAKCMTIDKAPAVLVVQLKRFEFSMFGHKINKKVDFDTELDLSPFMSNRRGPPQPYSLYGVLVHSGHSVHSGHYFAFVKAPNGLWHQLDDNHVSQVSERVVLAQKAYILFYIKNPPTNGHAVPAQPVSPKPNTVTHSEQQKPQSGQLGNKQSAPVRPESTPHTNGQSSKAAAVIFGPAEHPSTGLTAARELRDHLLAPSAADTTKKQPQMLSSRQPADAAGSGRTEIVAPTQSKAQQGSATCEGIAQQATSVANCAARQQAEAPEQAKASVKRKSDVLAVSNRRGMLQRMNLSGLEAAVDSSAGVPKRKKAATDRSVSASRAATEMPLRSVVREDDPGSATESSQQQADHAASHGDEPTNQQLPSTSQRSHQDMQAASAIKACRHVAEGAHKAGEGAASPASAHDSPVRHAPAIRSPVRRPARNALFPSPSNSWQGRSWNRLNMHHQIHRSRQLSSVGLPHIIAGAHSRRSISASPEGHVVPSPSKALAPAHSAAGDEQSLSRQDRSSQPTAVPAGAKPCVKRKLLHAVSAGSDTSQLAAEQLQQQLPALPKQAKENGVARILKAKVGERAAKQSMHVHSNGAQLPGDCAVGADGTLPAADFSADSLPKSVSAVTASKAAAQPPLLVQSTLVKDSRSAPKVGPANVKDFLNGMRPNLASWEDVGAELAKQAASLNRQQAPKKRKGPDDWDAEYDKGKVKKVKSKGGGPDAWQLGTDVFCKAARRGRGGFRGRSSDRGGRGGDRNGRGGGRGRSGGRGRGSGGRHGMARGHRGRH